MRGPRCRVDAGSGALQPIRIHACILERVPARLEHHALLRVEKLRLHRRDPEERRVEAIEIVDEGPVAARRAACRFVGKHLAQAPHAGARHALRHGIHAAVKQPPERLEAVGLGKAARHADNRDGFAQPRAPRAFGRRPVWRSPGNFGWYLLFHTGCLPDSEWAGNRSLPPVVSHFDFLGLPPVPGFGPGRCGSGARASISPTIQGMSRSW